MANLQVAPLSTYARQWLDKLPDLRSFLYERFLYAYAAAYDDMIAYIVQQATSTPGLSEEVDAYPDLLTFFVAYLIEEASSHIDPRQDQGVGQLLDVERLGTFNDFVDWVDEGYVANRTAENYPRRLSYWKNIIWADKEKYRKVLDARQSYSRSLNAVPYWLVWNYGSTYIYQREGYPNFPGIFFIEHGLITLDQYKEKTRQDIFAGIKMYLLKLRVPMFTPTLQYLDWSSLYPSLYQKVIS